MTKVLPLAHTTPTLNEWDFGIVHDDLSINLVNIDDQTLSLTSDEFVNPFYVEVSKNSYLDKIDEKQYYTTYKRAIIMCMRSSYQNEPEAEDIYSLIMTK